METRYLNTLVASVEAGTFSKAAEILHITQSAVSQRIKFLEDHFGQQLLDRSGQRLALTSAGKVSKSWSLHFRFKRLSGAKSAKRSFASDLKTYQSGTFLLFKTSLVFTIKPEEDRFGRKILRNKQLKI